MYATLTTGYNLTQGPQILFCYVNDVTSGLMMAMLLMTVWLVITISSFYIQKRQGMQGDLPVSMTLASVTLFIFAIILRLMTCPNLQLVSDASMIGIIAITIISIGALFFSIG